MVDGDIEVFAKLLHLTLLNGKIDVVIVNDDNTDFN